MKRRAFLQLSTAAFLAALGCRPSKSTKDYNVSIYSDRQSGHILREATKWKTFSSKPSKSEYLIVGGGLAGLSAAYALKNKDYQLFELSHQFGGTAGGSIYEGTAFCQGAHYDLYYPEHFGQEVAKVLEELEIIQFDAQRKIWAFREKQYMVSPENAENCQTPQGYRDAVLPDLAETYRFFEALKDFEGNMRLPTRLIAPKYHYLNQQSFAHFLEERNIKNFNLRQAINYQMLDDFGAGAGEVSALAGIYYYTSRPYGEGDLAEIFSPPQGNYYFVEKLLRNLNPKSLHLSHVVSRIHKLPNKGLEVEVLDLKAQKRKIYHCQKLVYAGHKQALKYVMPDIAPNFAHIRYAPWVVINFLFKPHVLPEAGYWQNEIIGQQALPPNHLLGFVDSSAQPKMQGKHRLLTVYYCFPPEKRAELISIEEQPEAIISTSLEHIAKYFQMDFSSLENATQKVFIKVMGHAMPIPQANYLFRTPKNLPNGLAFAGVDYARLPLLYEAIDSGLLAVKNLG